MDGYDGALMSSINAQLAFTDYYQLPPEGSRDTGIIFSISQLGQILGALFIWAAYWQRRRWHIFIGCLGACIGAVLTTTAPTIHLFIGGRFFLSFFSTFATGAGADVFDRAGSAAISRNCAKSAFVHLIGMSEEANNDMTLAGLYNTLYYLGSTLATCVVYDSNINLAQHGPISFRLALWLQMLCPGIVCLGIWLCPESPRWLVAKDRQEEARTVLAVLHADGELDHDLVDLQMAEINVSLRETGLED